MKILFKIILLSTFLLFTTTVYALEPIEDASLHSAEVFNDISKEEAIELIGKLAHEDMQETGILASVTIAQFILESAYGKSNLAQNSNNLFGMKAELSGNNWETAWNGTSTYTIDTVEQLSSGAYITITAPFRSYSSLEQCIRDHSLYLKNAKKGDEQRYKNIENETDYEKAFTILKEGGYATSHTYVEKLCKVVEKWDLTRFDEVENAE